MQNVEQLIRDRAYQLWLESGCRDGHADAHWLEAQRQILSAAVSEAGQVAKPVTKKPSKPKSAPAPRKKKRAA